jgi:RimJ/RimL family protein N-acetyltransferase
MRKAAPCELVFGEDQRVAEWAAGHSATGQLWDGKYVAIGLQRDGRLIAALAFTEFLPGGSVRGHIQSVGKHWLTRPFLRMIFLYPFMQLRVQRFNALIPAKNQKVRQFVEHLGFTLESTMVRALANDDVLVYRMFAEDDAWKRWVR